MLYTWNYYKVHQLHINFFKREGGNKPESAPLFINVILSTILEIHFNIYLLSTSSVKSN